MNATTNTLPRWAYLALALACVCMGLWASYITLEYFEHGAKALETDKALQALAVSAALMFVASEMAAFALAALLTERQLKARRWGLTAFAAAVLLLEVCTIVAVQLALTVGADMTQTSVTDTVADLQKQIVTVEANAKTYAATAESLRAADQLKKAAVQTDKAAAETAKASQLYDRLEKARTQKRPTLSGLMGEKAALAYAVARGVLVSLGGLVFFGVAGALLRAARGGALSVDAQLLALLHELRGTPGAAPIRMAMQVQDAQAPVQAPALAAPAAPAPAPAVAPAPAPAAPAPAAAPFTFTGFQKAPATPMPAPAPAGVPTGLHYSGKALMAGAGALAAAAAPMAHSAPAVPSAGAANHAPGASETVQSGASVSVQSPALEQAPAEPLASAANGASVSVQSEAQKPRVKRAVSAKIDTGTDGKAGARFKRIKAGVVAGKIRPSIRGIQAVEGGSQDVVLDYLRQLETEGVIVRAGRGYALVKKGGAA